MQTSLKFIVLLLLSFYACKSNKQVNSAKSQHGKFTVKSTTKAGQSIDLIGTVKDLDTQEPIVGANFTLTNDKGTSLGAVTNLEGFLSIKNMASGVYSLTITSMDYQEIKTTIEIKPNTGYEINVALARYIKQVEKPIIYLYPTQKQPIHVKLNYQGTLTHTYPKYPNSGWSMLAEPNGMLWDEKGMEYYALFWEGTPNRQLIPQDGFVVAGKETAAFLEEKLAYLGLNRREANEFMMYWLPRMENNPFNFIHFSGKAYEHQAELIITPKPETTIRVMMLTQPLKSTLEFPLQDLTPLKKSRKGFTLVEWGGTVINSIIDNS